MKETDLKETRQALKQVFEKYGKSPAAARMFLKKMGYLTKSGKVARPYAATPRKRVRSGG